MEEEGKEEGKGNVEEAEAEGRIRLRLVTKGKLV